MNKLLLGWYQRNLGLWLIILINLSLLISFFLNHSNAKIILVIFLIQSVFLGIENILKMLFSKTGEIVKMNGVDQPSTIFTNLFMAGFFTIHYGIFLMFFGIMAALSKNLPPANPEKYATIFPIFLLIGMGIILELPGKLKSVRVSPPGLFKLMFVPYIRLAPLGLIILGENIPQILLFSLFLVLKTGVDIVYYFVVDKPQQNHLFSAL